MSFALTQWRLRYLDFTGGRTVAIHELHQKYGPTVRIGPNKVAVTKPEDVKQIYGAGSDYSKTNLYDLFVVYNTRNMFCILDAKPHAERKKLLSHVYSKSYMMTPAIEAMVQGIVRNYLDYVDNRTDDVYLSLHYFGLDVITSFLYGPPPYGTNLLKSTEHLNMLDDMIIVSKTKFVWSIIHFPRYMALLLNNIKLARRFGLVRTTDLPYDGIRRYALDVFYKYKANCVGKEKMSVLSKMFPYHVSQGGTLSDYDLASE